MDLLSVSPGIAAGRPRLLGMPIVQKNSGTGRGGPASRPGVGEQSQAFPLATNMHYPSSKREYTNVDGMVY